MVSPTNALSPALCQLNSPVTPFTIVSPTTSSIVATIVTPTTSPSVVVAIVPLIATFRCIIQFPSLH